MPEAAQSGIAADEAAGTANDITNQPTDSQSRESGEDNPHFYYNRRPFQTDSK
jgi:hypothetical protein